ncbi:MAG: DUF1540 domain-containing protein [Clostridia bacterium]|nr:DUF1540 domain-containing protein [Clostridia bacterium]
MEHKSGNCKSGCDGKAIKGIVCGVKSCAYHDGKDQCHAQSVCIGPCDAQCSASTACATYKPGECC